MAKIVCHVGQVGGLKLGRVPFPYSEVERFAGIEGLFSKSSKKDIELTFVNALDTPIQIPGNEVSAFDLHSATKALTGNPSSPGPVNHIALLFAGTYSGEPSALGVMFDRGFRTRDDPNEIYAAVPREGCAVFVDAIAQFQIDRGVDPNVEFASKVIFTVIHELAHIFNLQHDAIGKNFLSPRVVPGRIDDDYWKFSEDQQFMLSKCSTRSSVHPGGSPFGSTGDLAETSFLKTKGAPSALDLRIALSQTEFFMCEPIELDVLATTQGSARSISIVNTLDPGYSNFVIWIRGPNGEVRKYHSTKYFCSGTSKVKILPNNPFQRDLSIFGESGGYTFKTAGNYQIWVEWFYSRASVARSDTIDFTVLPAPQRGACAQERYRALMLAAQAFFYRNKQISRRAAKALQYLAEAHHCTHSGASADYTLGRIFLDAKAKSSGNRKRLLKALTRLKRAIDSPHLSSHRREIAFALIEERC